MRAAVRTCAAIMTALGVALATAAADRPLLAPADSAWRVDGNFARSREARVNLSGAACTRRKPPFDACLIVNDDKKYAQFFAIEGTTLIPGAVIRLVPDEGASDPDAEGAAFDNGHFYIAGSHGRPRNPTDRNADARRIVFRIPVDPNTGKPPFAVSGDDVVGVDVSRRLGTALRTAPEIGAFHDKPLEENGLNIEGIAVTGGRMYLGLRGPTIEGRAFIASVDAAALFTADGALDLKVASLRLGPDTGIRDLAAVDDGLLVLSGARNEQAITPGLFLWKPASGALRHLADLDTAAAGVSAKAETILVLGDQPNQPYRVLILFDGPENGRPTEYVVPR